MTDQSKQPAWFFWFFAAYTALSMIGFAYLVFDFVTHPIAPDSLYGSVAYRIITALFFAPLSVITSILILRRRPRNVIGLFLLSWTTIVMADSLRADAAVPTQIFNFSYQGYWLLPLFFPDGQPSPQRFQRFLRYFAVVGTVSFCAFTIVSPTVFLDAGGTVANPLYSPILAPFSQIIGAVQFFTWIITLLLIVPSLVIRYRGASATVRQQIKWFVLGELILIIPFMAMLFFDPTNTQGPPIWVHPFFNLTPFLTIGYAILRRQLYDIDIIIRRTLIYSILTAVLAAIYFGGVVLAQQIFRAITGESYDLAIVASTLLIAALVNPLRHRIQQTIDHRFYRRKYDAEKTLARFNRTLRDEVDVETLQTHLIGVVQDTMQPDRLALWIPSAKESQS